MFYDSTSHSSILALWTSVGIHPCSFIPCGPFPLITWVGLSVLALPMAEGSRCIQEPRVSCRDPSSVLVCSRVCPRHPKLDFPLSLLFLAWGFTQTLEISSCCHHGQITPIPTFFLIHLHLSSALICPESIFSLLWLSQSPGSSSQSAEGGRRVRAWRSGGRTHSNPGE